MTDTNLLLASLAANDLDLFQSRLKRVELEQRHILYRTGDTVESVYFPVNAVISLVAELSDGDLIEAAMSGRDGMVGAAAALDGKISLSRAVVQIGGDALMCGVDDFKHAVERRDSLRSIIMRHEQTVFAQAQQSAACMASHQVEARLCRWLLRARDLYGDHVLPLTQEFLAEMLGVRRTSVSVVAHTLQQAGLIKFTRGKIQIVNLEGIEQTVCECYATVRSHYDALLGRARND